MHTNNAICAAHIAQASGERRATNDERAVQQPSIVYLHLCMQGPYGVSLDGGDAVL